jgi:hypothetical protein
VSLQIGTAGEEQSETGYTFQEFAVWRSATRVTYVLLRNKNLFLLAATGAGPVLLLDRQHHLAKLLCLSNSSPGEGATAIGTLREEQAGGSLTSKYGREREIPLDATPRLWASITI